MLVVLMCPCSFTFIPSADLTLLSSFPTRRSSDLELVRVEELRIRPEPYARAGVALADGADRFEPGADTGTRIRFRSEEHTSELQSRQYLVCRLLLEKKIIVKKYNEFIIDYDVI